MIVTIEKSFTCKPLNTKSVSPMCYKSNSLLKNNKDATAPTVRPPPGKKINKPATCK